MGRAHFSKRVIRDDKEHGFLSLSDAFRVSSNIVTGRLANAIGGATLHHWARRFGFGSATGLLLPAEQRGAVPRHRWSEYMTAAFAIGHGVSVTTVQLAAAYAALANGGLLMKPYLVRTITNPDGQVVYRRQSQVVRRVLTPVVAAEIMRMARRVVTDGTAQPVHDPEFPLAGKTGTAEKPDLATGRMLKNKYMASFAGMWPAHAPQLVGVIVLDEPEPIHYGGWTAAPILLNTFRRGSCAKKTNADLRPYLMATTGTPEVPGIRHHQDHSSQRLSFWQRRSGRIARAEQLSTGIMPDVRGLTAREAVTLIAGCGLETTVSGLGTVFRQIPASGTEISPGESCKLVLR
jgi:cell division protein FtsI/penicillin-binding protein 2